MLELLATVDPMQTLLGMLWLFAAGMFPAGMMLGSQCSPCCGCSACVEGTLPDTLTVTFDGLTDKTKGPDLISVGFSSCYGSGAAARVTAPGGDPVTDKGPIGTVSLTNAGSGYAKFGRVAPTITASGGSGSGATLTVTTTKTQDACKVDYWAVSSVSVSGGTGYADGDAVTFSVATGDTEEQAASATIHTTRQEPTLTASAPGGSGATFTISYTANSGSPSTWAVSGVSVTDGGTGYSGGSYLTFTPGSGDKTTETAYAVIVTNRLEPTLSASVTSETGSGASLAVTLSSYSGYEGTEWSVSALTISSGGSGYAEGDPVAITVTDGQASMWNYFDAAVSAVDGSGAITAITINYGGSYYKDEGIVQSVTVYYGGAYYKDDGVPASVSVDGGGIYYREDATATPYVADVTVSISQDPPSTGTGASITATVEDDPGSANFGKIVALTIADGGNDYLAWKWLNTPCCGWFWNGKPVVLKRNNGVSGSFYGDPCVYSHRMCGGWNISGAKGHVVLRYYGPSSPPTIELVTEYLPSEGPQWSASTCNSFFIADKNITNCSDWSGVTFNQSSSAGFLVYTHTPAGEGTAEVAAGGDYNDGYKSGNCHSCCQGEAVPPSEITVTVTDTSGVKEYLGDRSGEYVLSRQGWYLYPTLRWGFGQWQGNQYPWGAGALNFGIAVQLSLCESFYGCEECIKKCQQSHAIGYGYSGPDGGWYWPYGIYSDTRAFDPYQCLQCAESAPVCRPNAISTSHKWFGIENEVQMQLTVEA